MIIIALILTVCSNTTKECYDIEPITWQAESMSEYKIDFDSCVNKSKSLQVKDEEYIVESYCESYS